MAEVDADIWVLTETHVGHAPSDDHRHVVFSPPSPGRVDDPERWTAIWSRWPLTELTDPAPHHHGTVAATVETPAGPLIVYGTVIAWANEPTLDDGTPATMWKVHLAEIERQGSEWKAIRSRYPAVPLVVAGDFNQNRDGHQWYGTTEGRERLGDALEQAKLTCLTAIDVVAKGLLESDRLIDHVCVTDDLKDDHKVHCMEKVDDMEQRLSDHPTVIVDLTYP